uniref:Thg1 domain-containing protein n=1 Tax=Macrostomum lignano TaxID=282301 RepID=A0A1I8FRQ2_9PLAT
SRACSDPIGFSVASANRIATDVHELALDCERQPPTLEQFVTAGVAESIGFTTVARLEIDENFLSRGRLTTRDPKRFWDSLRQWMTERGGAARMFGDGTETVALYGFKWFSSATDSDMTLALARVVRTASGASPNAWKLAGLSLSSSRVAKPRQSGPAKRPFRWLRLKNKATAHGATAADRLAGCPPDWRAAVARVALRSPPCLASFTGLAQRRARCRQLWAALSASCVARDTLGQRTHLANRISEYSALHVRGAFSEPRVHSRAACLFAIELRAALGLTRVRLLLPAMQLTPQLGEV